MSKEMTDNCEVIMPTILMLTTQLPANSNMGVALSFEVSKVASLFNLFLTHSFLEFIKV